VKTVAAIVNADDLGMSREVNDATFDLMSKGRITSATIMANAPATCDAARRASTFAKGSFGVHLNLTEFEPVIAGAGARLLVDERGRMSRANGTLRLHPERLRAIYQEICAQIERVAALGVRITHLDSHHHVHTRPGFFPILKDVQRRYRIRRVRLAKNFYAPDQRCRADLRLKKRAYNWLLKSVYATYTTDAFTEFLTYYHADAASKRSINSIELMVHPGAAYAADETAVLERDWTTENDLRVQLISYAELSSDGRVAPPRALMSKDFVPCD
jgi:predicted glycoside hydrolase/deacetylase ChbG (UPF0249 family)